MGANDYFSENEYIFMDNMLLERAQLQTQIHSTHQYEYIYKENTWTTNDL